MVPPGVDQCDHGLEIHFAVCRPILYYSSASKSLCSPRIGTSRSYSMPVFSLLARVAPKPPPPRILSTDNRDPRCQRGSYHWWSRSGRSGTPTEVQNRNRDAVGICSHNFSQNFGYLEARRNLEGRITCEMAIFRQLILRDATNFIAFIDLPYLRS